LVDPSKESIDNLHAFLSQTKELLSLFLTSEEISKGFDPLAVHDSDNDDREDDAVEEDFKYDSLKKKVMKKEKTSQMLN
jgi:hypothetical protein